MTTNPHNTIPAGHLTVGDIILDPNTWPVRREVLRIGRGSRLYVHVTLSASHGRSIGTAFRTDRQIEVVGRSIEVAG